MDHKIEDHLVYYHNKRDPEENEATRLPTDEHVRIKCVWVVEAYPPSHINNLLQGFKELNWDKGRFSRETLTSNIDYHRKTGRAGVNNLGLISSGPTKWMFRDRLSEFPSGIDFARASLYHILPSTTVLMVQFVLTAETETYLEEPLQRAYSTNAIPNDKGYSFNTPCHQKAASVKAVRDQFNGTLYSWFNNNFPGIFCELGVSLPTCEFLTLDQGTPNSKRPHTLRGNYLTMLDLNDSFDVWQCDEIHGAYLSKPRDSYSHLVFAANLHELLCNEDLESYGGRDTGGFTNRLNLSCVEPVLAMWATSVLSECYQAELVKINDTVATVNLVDVSTGVPQIRSNQSKLLKLNCNIPLFIVESKRFLERGNFFVGDTSDFKRTNQNVDTDTFLDEVHWIIKEGVVRLSDLQASAKQSVQTAADILVASSNDKLSETNLSIQKAMKHMTEAILVLTALMALPDSNFQAVIKYAFLLLLGAYLVKYVWHR